MTSTDIEERFPVRDFLFIRTFSSHSIPKQIPWLSTVLNLSLVPSFLIALSTGIF